MPDQPLCECGHGKLEHSLAAKRCWVCVPGKCQEFKPRAEAVCQRFTGLRQWGIDPEPWRRCTVCGWPRAQHNLPSCTAALNIKGEHFFCDLTMPHQGWAHSNKVAQAIWCDDGTQGSLGSRSTQQAMDTMPKENQG